MSKRKWKLCPACSHTADVGLCEHCANHHKTTRTAWGFFHPDGKTWERRCIECAIYCQGSGLCDWAPATVELKMFEAGINAGTRCEGCHQPMQGDDPRQLALPGLADYLHSQASPPSDLAEWMTKAEASAAKAKKAMENLLGIAMPTNQGVMTLKATTPGWTGEADVEAEWSHRAAPVGCGCAACGAPEFWPEGFRPAAHQRAIDELIQSVGGTP